ncbi:MAG: hypothetical protein WCE90_04155 [Candidatus Zixiibacteriota bacterium]
MASALVSAGARAIPYESFPSSWVCLSADTMSGEASMSLLVPALIFLGILGGAFVVVRNRWISKKPTRYAAQFTAQSIFMQYQNLQKKKSVEHVLQRKEEEKEHAEGDDLSHFLRT